MKYKLIKDKKFRNRSYKDEKLKKLLQYTTKSNYIDQSEKNRLLFIRSKNWKNMVVHNKYNNRCVLTNRSRGVYSNSQLSRMEFKKYSNRSVLNGIQIINW